MRMYVPINKNGIWRELSSICTLFKDARIDSYTMESLKEYGKYIGKRKEHMSL